MKTIDAKDILALSNLGQTWFKQAVLALALTGCAAQPPTHHQIQIYDEHFNPIPSDEGMDCHEAPIDPKEQA